ncbi:MAG: malonyl-CoA decarboxylase [Alphaproteobacteria bacterium]|nr:malonyl-CoA decarboxylase [Alphaproteobacteria bacterium]
MATGWLNRIIGSIADQGRELFASRSGRPIGGDLATLCHDLIGERGEASGTALARAVVERYAALGPAERLAFFELLAAQFGPDQAAILLAADAYRRDAALANLLKLAAATEAPRQELFRRVNMAPDGTATLVAMREHLLDLLRDRPQLESVDADLHHLLASWFNRGFLRLERIDWRTSAAVLEKLIAYEAVHAIEGWEDLRRRLQDDRRCFAFFHPALPDEPLIFVEVALTRGIAAAVQPLIARDAPVADPAGADTAIFYSISNCQKGLRGISFGNFLIKQVVADLQQELPQVETFSTLSPIPGLRAWLKKEGRADGDAAAASERFDPASPDATVMKAPLMRLCARYLLQAKKDGKPVDPVARFHLGNGARVERINWLGDVSAKGVRESCCLMVNYLYRPEDIERNHEAYANEGRIAASSAVRGLLKE